MLPEGYVLRRVDALPERPVRDLIHSELFAGTGAVRARDLLPADRQQRVAARLALAVDARDALAFGIWRAGELVAFTKCAAYRPGALMMEASVVHPDHRRRGLYSSLVRSTCAEARDRGYLDVASKHVAGNNAVLIAKLRLGFVVAGTEVSPEFGVLVLLTCPLDPERRALLERRTGWTA